MKTRIDLMTRVLLLVLSLGVGISSNAQDAEIKKAIRFLDIDQPTKAVETMNQALATYPTNNKLYYYLGYVQLKTGNPGQALKTFEKGVSLNPEEAINHVGLGAI